MEGAVALSSWLRTNLKYPVIAQEHGVQARVLILFVVDKNGKITEPVPVLLRNMNNTAQYADYLEQVSQGKKSKDEAVALRRALSELEKEGMRVVGIMPDWKPGKKNGEAVDVKFTLPITFRLQ